MEVTWYTLLLLVTGVLVNGSRQGCAPCTCDYRMRTVDCGNLGLEDVPELPNKDRIRSLNLRGNNFTSITLNSFRSLDSLLLCDNPAKNIALNLPRLKKLDLTGIEFNSMADIEITENEINEIKGLHVLRAEGRPFEKFSELKSLELRIGAHTIPWNFLHGLIYLEQLTLVLDEVESLHEMFLNSTQIRLISLEITAPKLLSIKPRMLERLGVLRHISLDLPAVQNISDKLLVGELSYATDDIYLPDAVRPIVINMMRQLRHNRQYDSITLKNIHTLPNNLFRDLATLKRINLKHIKVIPDKIFKQFKMALEVLDLSQNDLDHVSGELFSDLKRVRCLNLSHNQLTTLERGTFGSLMSVESLDLSYNNISYLDTKVVYELRNSLKFLNLSHNTLDILPIDLFKGQFSMKKLDMNNLGLVSLRNRTFVDLTALEHLNLRSNKLTNVTKDTFIGPKDLKEIDLSFNQISALPEGIFQDLFNLLRVNLENNLIENLPPFFLYDADELETVDLDGNEIFCDCGLVTLLDSAVNVTCSAPDRYKGMLLEDTDISVESCATTVPPETTRATTQEVTSTESLSTTETLTKDIPLGDAATGESGSTGSTPYDNEDDSKTTQVVFHSTDSATSEKASTELPTTSEDGQSTKATHNTRTQEMLPNDTKPKGDKYNHNGESNAATTTKFNPTKNSATTIQPNTATDMNKQSRKSVDQQNDMPDPPPVQIGTLKENGESADFLPVSLWIVVVLLVIIDITVAYIVYKRVRKSKRNERPLLSKENDTFC